MSMRKETIRKISGVALLIIAIGMLALWESKGRELMLMDEVYVTASELSAGTVINAELFRTVSVPKDAVADGALKPGNEGAFDGLILSSDMVAGEQIPLSSLKEAGSEQENLASFVIKNEWIFMCPSSLRQGYTAEIYGSDGAHSFGTFMLAHVKDERGVEIKDVYSGGGGLLGSSSSSGAFSESSGEIDHIEIICDLAAYMEMKQYAEAEDKPSLLIVSGKGVM